MKCPKCGAQANSSSWFCPECDAPLHSDDDIIPGDQVRTARPEREAEPEPDEIRRRNRKAWTIRIIITVLIISVLVLALILLANSRKSPGMDIRSRAMLSYPASNISGGASGMSSGDRPVPVSTSSYSPSLPFRR
jgi:uncharacterized membrane protein YvbJ